MWAFLSWLRTVYRRLLQLLRMLLFREKPWLRFGRRTGKQDRNPVYLSPPKPPWVRREILRLKALMPDAGCRRIAATFNRRFAGPRQMTVGKTFVNEVIRDHQDTTLFACFCGTWLGQCSAKMYPKQ